MCGSHHQLCWLQTTQGTNNSVVRLRHDVCRAWGHSHSITWWEQQWEGEEQRICEEEKKDFHFFHFARFLKTRPRQAWCFLLWRVWLWHCALLVSRARGSSQCHQHPVTLWPYETSGDQKHRNKIHSYTRDINPWISGPWRRQYFLIRMFLQISVPPFQIPGLWDWPSEPPLLLSHCKI